MEKKSLDIRNNSLYRLPDEEIAKFGSTRMYIAEAAKTPYEKRRLVISNVTKSNNWQSLLNNVLEK